MAQLICKKSEIGPNDNIVVCAYFQGTPTEHELREACSKWHEEAWDQYDQGPERHDDPVSKMAGLERRILGDDC